MRKKMSTIHRSWRRDSSSLTAPTGLARFQENAMRRVGGSDSGSTSQASDAFVKQAAADGRAQHEAEAERHPDETKRLGTPLGGRDVGDIGTGGAHG